MEVSFYSCSFCGDFIDDYEYLLMKIFNTILNYKERKEHLDVRLNDIYKYNIRFKGNI